MNNEYKEIYEQSEPIYRTTLNKKVSPVLITVSFACIIASIIVGNTVDNEIVVGVTICALLLVMFVFMGVVIFVIMPKLRIIQSRLDIKNYDFSPYTSNAEEETFYNEIPFRIKHYKSLNLFEEKESKVTVRGWEDLNKYLNGFPAENCLDVVHLDPYENEKFIDFFIYGSEEQTYIVSKKTDGELYSVIISEQHEITFTSEGLKFGDKFLKYDKITATAVAAFTYKTIANIIIETDEDDGVGINFTISPKIIALLDKSGVQINDRFIADYILKNPEQAFEKIAVLNSPNRIKKYILKSQQ